MKYSPMAVAAYGATNWRPGGSSPEATTTTE